MGYMFICPKCDTEIQLFGWATQNEGDTYDVFCNHCLQTSTVICDANGELHAKEELEMAKDIKTYRDGVKAVKDTINELTGFYTESELTKMFGTPDVVQIITANELEDITAKLKDFNDNERIRVEDVVIVADVIRVADSVYYTLFGVVTHIDDCAITILTDDGTFHIYDRDSYRYRITKTGRTIDISSVLEQLKNIEIKDEEVTE